MRTAALFNSLLAVNACWAADFSGEWIAEVSAKGAESQYARVHLASTGAALTGTWNQLKLDGSVKDKNVSFSLSHNGTRVASLTGVEAVSSLEGEGQMAAGGRGGSAGQMEQVAWKLSRPVRRPAGAPRPRGVRRGSPARYAFTGRG